MKNRPVEIQHKSCLVDSPWRWTGQGWIVMSYQASQPQQKLHSPGGRLDHWLPAEKTAEKNVLQSVWSPVHFLLHLFAIF